MVRVYCLAVYLVMGVAAQAQNLSLPRIFSDHMVLQRDQPARFWGWTEPYSEVTISIDDFGIRTRSDASGNWETTYPAHPSGGPFSIVIKSETSITLKDVYFGDVWVFGGYLGIDSKLGAEGKVEVKEDGFSQIRFIEIPRYMTSRPAKDISFADWRPAIPKHAPDFSAIAWFFAKENYLEKGVPVGIIECGWGNAPMESFVSFDRLFSVPGYEEEVTKMLDKTVDWEARMKTYESKRVWKKGKLQTDTESLRETEAFHPDFDDSSWDSVRLPNSEPIMGFAWLRRTIRLKNPTEVKLFLGTMSDIGNVFINGKVIGNKPWQDEDQVLLVPDDLLRKGDNLLAIRLANSDTSRVWIGFDSNFWLENRGSKMPLDGFWKYSNKIEKKVVEEKSTEWYPGSLFNAMINPITGYTMRGVIWNQGDKPTSEFQFYAGLFESMIEDWRIHWRLGRFPFVFMGFPENDFTVAYLEEQKKVTKYPKVGMVSGMASQESNAGQANQLWKVASTLAFD